MSDALSPPAWARHVDEIDDVPGYLLLGGSLVRVVVTENQRGHLDLVAELDDLAERRALVSIRVDAANCPKLHQPQLVLASVVQSLDLFRVFVDVATEIWRRLGYPTSEVTLGKVAERHGMLINDLRTEFRGESRRFLEAERGLTRDFKTAVRNILLELIDGEHRGRAGVQRLESYFRGTLGARDLFDLGIQRKVSKETSTPALRNLTALLHLAGRAGCLLHLDLRWVTDEHLLTEGPLSRATRTQRVAVYQWIRELIDGIDRFTSTVVCAEFGPQFPDPAFNGKGWGLYDALRLRLEDGVRPSGGPNASAPFVPLGDV